MSDYKAVSDALASGAEPAMLCTTCPWDRNCVTPPTMTRDQIDAEIKKASAADEEERARAIADGKPPGIPVGSLMTAVAFGGRDTAAQICPVFALRLRSAGGRDIADRARSWMQEWDDQS